MTRALITTLLATLLVAALLITHEAVNDYRDATAQREAISRASGD
jgi:hypothetical protein